MSYKSLSDIGITNDGVYFIAEAGNNHNGDVMNAYKLIDMALSAGADCVKFQKRNNRMLMAKSLYDSEYKSANAFGKTYGEHRENLELSNDEFIKVADYAKSKGITFTASCWDHDSLEFVDKVIGVPFFKVGSPDLTNFPLLEDTAKRGKPIVLSTGMADMTVVRNAVQLIMQHNDQLAILHCISCYPLPDNLINMNVLHTLKSEYPNLIIGYSGHETNPLVPIVAVSMGARIIEKHITLDKTMKGTDHQLSLEHDELKQMISQLKSVITIQGNNIKQLYPQEMGTFMKLAKSVCTTQHLDAGHVLTYDDLICKGPGDGITAMNFHDVVGRVLNKPLDADVTIKYDDLL